MDNATHFEQSLRGLEAGLMGPRDTSGDIPEISRRSAEVEHTPGPWTYDGEYVESLDLDTPVSVATIADCGDSTGANARLIAAAPALLAALEAVQWSGSTSERRCPCCEYVFPDDGGHAKDCDLANAIDAARGES